MPHIGIGGHLILPSAQEMGFLKTGTGGASARAVGFPLQFRYGFRYFEKDLEMSEE